MPGKNTYLPLILTKEEKLSIDACALLVQLAEQLRLDCVSRTDAADTLDRIVHIIEPK